MKNESTREQIGANAVDPILTIESTFLARKNKNPQYSLRSFARDLGVTPGEISRLLNRHRHLTRRQAARIAVAMNLSKRETALFIKNTILSAPKKAKVPKSLREKAKASSLTNHQRATMTDYSVERFKAISQWYHLPILELTFLKSFVANERWIAEKIGISTIEARDAIKRLIDLGLLESCPIKGLRKTVNRIFIDSHSEPEIRKYERSMIDKAITRLESAQGAQLDQQLINSIHFPVSLELMPKIRKEIFEFQRRILKLIQSKPYEEIYQLNCQLFPLTSSVHKRGKK